MRGVRLGVGQHRARRVEAQTRSGSRSEGVDRRVLERVDLRPEPVGERKSGMPLSVETPAPVRATHGWRVADQLG